MKKARTYFSQGLLVGFLVSLLGCQQVREDDIAPVLDQAAVLEVTLNPTVRLQAAEPFVIRFMKTDHCQKVVETRFYTTGLTMNYNVILEAVVRPCPAITTRQDSTQATFTAPSPGDYTVNFLLNNRLLLVRKVTVLP